MIKRVTVFLTIATIAVGSWVLSQGHTQVSACNSYASQFKGTVAHAGCARAQSSYFTGVALTMGGLVILVLLLFAFVRRTRSRDWHEQMPTIPQQRQHAIGTAAR